METNKNNSKTSILGENTTKTSGKALFVRKKEKTNKVKGKLIWIKQWYRQNVRSTSQRKILILPLVSLKKKDLWRKKNRKILTTFLLKL